MMEERVARSPASRSGEGPWPSSCARSTAATRPSDRRAGRHRPLRAPRAELGHLSALSLFSDAAVLTATRRRRILYERIAPFSDQVVWNLAGLRPRAHVAGAARGVHGRARAGR